MNAADEVAGVNGSHVFEEKLRSDGETRLQSSGSISGGLVDPLYSGYHLTFVIKLLTLFFLFSGQELVPLQLFLLHDFTQPVVVPGSKRHSCQLRPGRAATGRSP